MSERRTRLMVHGQRGRMGTRVTELAKSDPRFELVETLALDARAEARGEREACAIIDFTSDRGALEVSDVARAQKAALLVGSTGLSDKTLRAIHETGKVAPVMVAPNTSLGVAVLAFLVRKAVELLGEQVNADLIEQHHTMKKDSPSGTALRLADAANTAMPGCLPPSRIHAIRAGDIVGEHQIQLAMPGERILLSHAATSRDVFARGAISAAAWLVKQTPGVYQIEDSLGLPRS